MSDSKELEELMGKYTPEQVEMFQKLATLQYSQATYAANLQKDEEVHLVEIQQKRAVTKLADYQVELVKDSMRPHMQYKADIGQEPTSGAYYCKLPAVLDIFDDAEESSNIVAYGSTPAEACDNFDTLWVQGRYGRDNV